MVWEYSLPWQTEPVCDQTGIRSGNPKPSSPSVPSSPGIHLTPANLAAAGSGGEARQRLRQGSAGAPQVQTATSRHTELTELPEPPFLMAHTNLPGQLPRKCF